MVIISRTLWECLPHQIKLYSTCAVLTSISKYLKAWRVGPEFRHWAQVSMWHWGSDELMSGRNVSWLTPCVCPFPSVCQENRTITSLTNYKWRKCGSMCGASHIATNWTLPLLMLHGAFCDAYSNTPSWKRESFAAKRAELEYMQSTFPDGVIRSCQKVEILRNSSPQASHRRVNASSLQGRGN